MTLRETMARDAIALTNANEFGEEITYVFKDGTPDRQILAVVDRQDTEPAAGAAPQVARLKAIVEFANHATAGVTAVAPGDKLLLPMRLGQEAVTARITRVISHDEGMWRVEATA